MWDECFRGAGTGLKEGQHFFEANVIGVEPSLNHRIKTLAAR
jgi:hypothetical protein